jgi:monocyte-to-macrophage differentiation protein
MSSILFGQQKDCSKHEAAGNIEKKVTPLYYRCPCGFASIHLMNKMADDSDYRPAMLEELANVLTHFIPAVLSVFAVYYMFQTVITTKREAISASIYGGCCTLLFAISSSYHLTGLIWGKDNKLNRVFQKMDHTIIFTFIAASYTPWTILIDIGSNNSIGKAVTTFIWTFALFGTMKSCLSNFLPNVSSLFLYLTMGWVSVIYIGIIVYMRSTGLLITELQFSESMIEVGIGGLLYSLGTIVFQLDGRIPFAHAIWHCFVAAAAGFQMHAVHSYLMILE